MFFKCLGYLVFVVYKTKLCHYSTKSFSSKTQYYGQSLIDLFDYLDVTNPPKSGKKRNLDENTLFDERTKGAFGRVGTLYENVLSYEAHGFEGRFISTKDVAKNDCLGLLGCTDANGEYNEQTLCLHGNALVVCPIN